MKKRNWTELTVFTAVLICLPYVGHADVLHSHNYWAPFWNFGSGPVSDHVVRGAPAPALASGVPSFLLLLAGGLAVQFWQLWREVAEK